MYFLDELPRACPGRLPLWSRIFGQDTQFASHRGFAARGGGPRDRDRRRVMNATRKGTAESGAGARGGWAAGRYRVRHASCHRAMGRVHTPSLPCAHTGSSGSTPRQKRVSSDQQRAAPRCFRRRVTLGTLALTCCAKPRTSRYAGGTYQERSASTSLEGLPRLQIE